jgi:hypothetical protein
MTSITQPTEAVIFIGMQASGKTSLDRQRFFEPTCALVST